jgi:hypothetical protein
MVTKIPVRKFEPVEEFTMCGLTMKSCYLNQYFRNFENGDVIHAEYTDYDDSCYYRLVTGLYEYTDKSGIRYIREHSTYLGMAETWYKCIFDDDYPDVVEGYVELDTERC